MPSINTKPNNRQLFLLIVFLQCWLLAFPSMAQSNAYKASKTGNLFYQQIDLNDTKVSSSNFESWLKTKHNLPSNTQLQAIQSEKDQLGFTHQRYQVLQSGIPIEGSMIITHRNESESITSYNGSLFPIKNANTQTKITPKEALQKAVEHIGAEQYRWEIAAENEHRKQITQGKKNTYLPTPELVFAPRNLDFKTQDFRLCYKIDIYALQPLQRLWVYVEAQTGEIIATQNQLCTFGGTGTVDKACSENSEVSNRCQSFSKGNLPTIQQSAKRNNLTISEAKQSAEGTAVTKYSGIQTITTHQETENRYLLQEENRNIFTYNMQQSNIFANATIFEDEDNYWNNFNEDQDEVATDVHWGTERTYDYFLEKHGRRSYDGNGIAIRSYVHYIIPALGQTFANAFWDGEHLVYGDGDGERRSAMTSLDICAHEFTHGVTDYTANLISNDESGGLNESFSDIMAIAVEYYAKPEAANFLLGEDVALGVEEAIRSAIAPKTLYAPDTYKGEYWSPNPRHVHNHSTVQTHWFYLLVHGGEGVNDYDQSYQVEGIGLEAAVQIAYRNLSVYLTPPSTYADARYFSIRAAMDLYGGCSFEAEQVAMAWYAVGVGDSEFPEIQAKFEVEESEFCSEEATVQFANHSIWADAYLWDFGDGNSSIEANPLHTYQGFGDYTVQLTATSCNDTESTFVEMNLISLSPDAYTCNPVNMNFNGIQVLNDCKGGLYDDGGELGDYTRNKQSRVLIEVEEADYIVLDFLQFNVSNYHELYIYDGKDSGAPLLSESFGSLVPNGGEPIIASGNALYLYFDAEINPLSGIQEERTFPGFEAFWTCHQNHQKPQIVSLDFNAPFICQGEVNFRQRALYQPTEWHWDFGDGNTSNEQNPHHIYREDGQYDVALIACNEFGCDTFRQEKLVEINQADLVCHEILVPKTGKTTANDCEGVIYDSGGKSVSYANNSNGLLVVAPPATERLGFVINTFNTEIKDDVLLIYDGTSVEAPLLLSESGVSFPKDTIWAESGAITLHFRSNESTVNRGFEIFYFAVPKAEKPIAAFNWSPAQAPLRVPVSFQNQSITANQWIWDFEDGITTKSKNVTRIFDESGDFEVTLTAKNCYASDSLQKNITVQPQPNLQISPDSFHITLMAGSSTTRTVNLSNIGMGDFYFGTATKAFEVDTVIEKYYTDLTPETYFFENVRSFDKLKLEVSINGDFDESNELILLQIEDEASFTIGATSESVANGTTITEVFSFDVDDDTTAKWLEDGQLKVKITKSNQVGLNEGGEDYYQIRLVTDHAEWLKVAKNGIVEDESGEELQVSFDASQLWVGTYFNELQLITNQAESESETISIPCTLEVLLHPVAFFEQVGKVSCEGSVEFRDKSINEPDSWEWNFGDGATSTERNPTNTYASKGDYNVTLKVCKEGTCSETSQNIFIAPIANFSPPSGTILLNKEVNFTNLSRGGTSYLWDFGDGTTSTQKHPKHTFKTAGNYAVQLMVETCFESDVITKNVQVQAAPMASISTDTLKVSLNSGEQSLQKLGIENSGMGALYYEASLQKSLGESSKEFDEAGGRTIHSFEGIGEEASDFLQLKVTLNGDFDALNEKVWVRLDGEGMQYISDNNTESAEDETYIVTLESPLYRHLLADGKLLVELENTEQVEPRSDRSNQHKVELIAHGIPWLSLLKESKTVEASETDSLEILFDASNLNVGIYEFSLQIYTNESEALQTSYSIPIQLEVSGAANMELSNAIIDFGAIRINESISKPFEIFNSGTDTLFIASMGTQSPVFEADTSSLVLPPKMRYQGQLTFSPSEIEVFGENFEIQSNVGVQTISLKGTAIGLPKISVQPDSLFVALPIGEQTQRTISVFNTGDYELKFSAQNASFTRFDSLTTQDFYKVGDTTIHIFENLQRADSLQLVVEVSGDFNRKSEFADVYVNGERKKRVGDLVNDSTFNIQDSLTLAWMDLVMEEGAEDGKLEVMLVNSEEVNLGITIAQKHKVRLRTFDRPWMETGQGETQVPIENERVVAVDFDASNLALGTYHQDIEVFADDPEQPLTIVPTTLVVYEPPQVNFEVNLQGVCSGVVQFENLSSESILEWHWDFGDGTTSTEENPQHTYMMPDAYEVELVAVHEFSADTLRFDLEVDFAIADFAVPDTVFNGADFEVLNSSLGAVNYLWNFGDGATSSMENPVHQYDTTGIYTIQLIAQSANGCLDTLQKDMVVELKTGIDALNSLPDWLRVFPNPVESDLTIEVNRMFPMPIEVKLFNALGQLLKENRMEENTTTHKLKVHDLPKGLYYLQLEMEDFIGTQKIWVR